jgi:uncharacterized protein YvpB
MTFPIVQPAEIKMYMIAAMTSATMMLNFSISQVSQTENNRHT